MKTITKEIPNGTSTVVVHNGNEKQKKKVGLFILKAFISLLLILWILRNTNVSEIFRAIRGVNFYLIVIAYSLLFVGHYLSTLRWKTLLQAQGFHASVAHLFKSYMIGIFFNNLLPSTIGGDTSRAYDSWKIGKSKGKAVAVIFVDRFFGLFALLLFALSSLLFSSKLTQNLPFLNFWLIAGAMGMGLIVWVIFMPSLKIVRLIEAFNIPFSKPIKIILEKIIKSFLSFKGNKKALLKALLLSVLLQINVIIHYYLIAEALGFDIAFHNFFLIIPISLFLMMIPISINGIGIRENIFAFFFTILGTQRVDAVALAWIAYGFVIIQGIIGGIIYALRK